VARVRVIRVRATDSTRQKFAERHSARVNVARISPVNDEEFVHDRQSRAGDLPDTEEWPMPTSWIGRLVERVREWRRR